jgi:phosphatidate cytidylyltransferase
MLSLKAEKRIGMHLKRWITAVVGMPLIFFLVFSGSPIILSFILMVVAIIALWEYFRIIFKGYQRLIYYLALPAYVLAIAIIVSAYYNHLDWILLFLCLDVLFVGMISMPMFKSNPDLPDLIAKQVLSVVYIPTFLSFLVLLRNGVEGIGWVFFVLCIVAAGDVGAYYIGSYFGRHKLCPAVSPNKTIEGALGGICANLIIGLIFAFLFIDGLSWPLALIIAVTVGITGQLGDLFESQFKRASGVKDSSNLLPGHGGMLDRIDALLFATPMTYILKSIIIF